VEGLDRWFQDYAKGSKALFCEITGVPSSTADRVLKSWSIWDPAKSLFTEGGLDALRRAWPEQTWGGKATRAFDELKRLVERSENEEAPTDNSAAKQNNHQEPSNEDDSLIQSKARLNGIAQQPRPPRWLIPDDQYAIQAVLVADGSMLWGFLNTAKGCYPVDVPESTDQEETTFFAAFRAQIREFDNCRPIQLAFQHQMECRVFFTRILRGMNATGCALYVALRELQLESFHPPSVEPWPKGTLVVRRFGDAGPTPAITIRFHGRQPEPSTAG
jgi:hypothetical protein